MRRKADLPGGLADLMATVLRAGTAVAQKERQELKRKTVGSDRTEDEGESYYDPYHVLCQLMGRPDYVGATSSLACHVLDQSEKESLPFFVSWRRRGAVGPT